MSAPTETPKAADAATRTEANEAKAHGALKISETRLSVGAYAKAGILAWAAAYPKDPS